MRLMILHQLGDEMKQFIALILVFTFSHFSFASVSVRQEGVGQRMNALLLEGLSKEKYAGLSILVIDAEAGEFVGHYGYRDIEKKLVPDSDTQYEIGSISKTFLRLAMASQSQIKLLDPISKYLPSTVRVPKPSGKDILIRDLMTHTGIKFSVPCTVRLPDPNDLKCFGVNLDADLVDPYKNTSRENNYKFLTEYSYTLEEFPEYFTEPGIFYSYSNFGTGLLGEILGEQNGSSFEEFLRKQVLEKLGMNDTKIEMPCDVYGSCENLAQVYSKNLATDNWKQASVWHLPGLSAAGGIRSTISDMKKYLLAQMRPETSGIQETVEKTQEILPEATRLLNSNICKEGEQQHADMCNPSPKEAYYGWESVSPQTVLYHGGATGASQAMMMFSHDRTFGVVVLSNSKVGKGENTLYHYPNDVALCAFQLAGKPVVDYDFCSRL